MNHEVLVENVSVAFGNGKRGRDAVERTVVQDVSFSVEPGEFVAIIGPSGCGKSTLLRVISGLLKPTYGQVQCGASVGAADDTYRVGFLFQSDSLLPWKSAIDNVSIAVALSGQHQKTDRITRAQELMTSLELADAGDRYPHQLSGGMRKRVALARTLAYEPAIFLLDEPFSALDALTRINVGNFFLSQLQETGQSVVFVTHDISEAVAMADRVLVMSLNPATIIHECRINIPRPRHYYRARFEDGFREYEEELWTALGFTDS